MKLFDTNTSYRDSDLLREKPVPIDFRQWLHRYQSLVESTGDTGIDLVLGDAGRVASFDEQLTGGKAGASKKFEIAYPADHNPAQLAGKTVAYEVNYISVSEPSYPELDADFAKSLGI